MKILILNSLYPTPLHPKIVGGAEKSVRHLAEALVREGHEVEVIRAIAPGAAPTREEVNGVVVHGAPSRNLYWPFDGQAQPAWRRLLWHLIDDRGPTPEIVGERLDAFRPDVVHTNTLAGLTTGVWRLARARGVRIVHTLRDYYLMCPRAKAYKAGRNCERPCRDCALLTRGRRAATALPDAVVGNSRATLDLLLAQGLFAGVPLRTAIGSLPEASAPLPPRDRGEAPRTLFGFIGRVTEEKGVERLAEAYGRLPQGAAGLVIAGETDPAVQTRLTALASGRDIRFLGFVPPETFYRAVDVVVAPSLWHEPLPRSVIDAISYGRPVIGSNRGGTPEAMGEPPFGWIFDPDVAGDLERVMGEAMSGALPFKARAASPVSPVAMYTAVYSGSTA